MKALFQRFVAFFYVYSEIWIRGICYMRRWRFMPDWLPGFRVHQILQSDDDRALHDHPFGFVTFILKGGYWEYLIDGSKKWHGAPGVLFRPAKTLHRIELAPCVKRGYGLLLQPAWTLVFRTRYYREWGFQTKNGWVHNREFVTKREGHHQDEGKAK